MTPSDAAERLRAALFAGAIMLEAGAEASRVEETVARLAEGLGLVEPEVFVMPTGIFVSASDDTGTPLSRMRRVRRRSINLDRVARINALSRAVSQRPSAFAPGVLLERLEAIAHARQRYPARLISLAGAVSAAAASLVIGGRLVDFLPALFANLVAQATSRSVLRGLPGAFNLAAAGLVSTLLAAALHMVFATVQPAPIVAGAIMSLVPGLAFTAAVQDGLAGDLVSAGARALEAILSAGALAAGVAIGLWLWPAAAQPAWGHALPVWLLLIMAFVGSLASAAAFQSPPAAVAWAGAVGACGWLFAHLAFTASGRAVFAPFVGAVALAALSVVLARWQKRPTPLYTAPALVPLVPGFTLYQGLLAVAEGRVTDAVSELLRAALVGVALAAGVALVTGVALQGGRRAAD